MDRNNIRVQKLPAFPLRSILLSGVKPAFMHVSFPIVSAFHDGAWDNAKDAENFNEEIMDAFASVPGFCIRSPQSAIGIPTVTNRAGEYLHLHPNHVHGYVRTDSISFVIDILSDCKTFRLVCDVDGKPIVEGIEGMYNLSDSTLNELFIQHQTEIFRLILRVAKEGISSTTLFDLCDSERIIRSENPPYGYSNDRLEYLLVMQLVEALATLGFLAKTSEKNRFALTYTTTAAGRAFLKKK